MDDSGEFPQEQATLPTESLHGSGMIAYFSILITACLAFAGLPIYIIIPCALALFSVSLIEQRKLSERFSAIGASYMLTMAAWQSAGEASLAAGAAYALGALMRGLIVS